MVYVNKALCSSIAANVQVKLDAERQSEYMAALASTFLRRCIVKLHLSGYFRASLQQVQPLGWNFIKSLTLYQFNGGITALPANLEQLCLYRTVMDADMMRIMTTTAPASLHTLQLLRWCPLACPPEGLQLPTTLRTLVCARYCMDTAELPRRARAFRIRLPDSLRHLHLVQWDVLKGTPFPTSLESLHLQGCTIGSEQDSDEEDDFDGSQQQRNGHDVVRLPAGLRKLVVAHCEFNCGFGSLPPSLITFDASRDNGANLANLDHDKWDDMLYSHMFYPYAWSLALLPPGLVHLDFSMLNAYDAPLGPLPCTLQFLHMGYQFCEELGPLPVSLKSLRVLRLGTEFAQPLSRLPEGLKELRLGSSFNHPLPPLPSTLETLVVDDKYAHPH
ncbi:hypothetical protein JKP88DRAFT_273699 [Tribonema minus]|uniref:Uncharacterized protein n=1 Tax=Tribonema minus TaxID=303371 RepID=A0A836CBW1_9STRA|nr:hypothetical protein JKP88DRAFT_273699 [Tribonema minus]